VDFERGWCIDGELSRDFHDEGLEVRVAVVTRENTERRDAIMACSGLDCPQAAWELISLGCPTERINMLSGEISIR